MDGKRKPGGPRSALGNWFGGRRWLGFRRSSWLAIGSVVVLAAGIAGGANAAAGGRTPFSSLDIESLDGSNNNQAHVNQGKVGTIYPRVTSAHFADGKNTMLSGPNPRVISDRIFNDKDQNIFSERNVSQFVWTWAQFLDHTFGLAQGGTEAANIPFNAKDQQEEFKNTLGVVPFTRDAAAPGSGTSTSNPRQTVNTVSSYIDAWSIYGGTNSRLEWMRDGPFDGNMANNGPTLMLPGGYLPTRTTRGNAALAPEMIVDGRLLSHPTDAVVAGDQRASENIALTSLHTLFAREHNRIVSMLPNTLTSQQKFDIARKVVVAEQQFITYHEFLPAVGVNLPAYAGYNPNVNASITNEFATVGYRGHSTIHGEIGIETEASRYTRAQLDAFAAMGIHIDPPPAPGEVALGVPLNLMFFNPGLLPQLGEGPVLKALAAEHQYKNDAIIDNHLRSVLFQVPLPGDTTCIEPVDPKCYSGVTDLAAIDVQRGFDHGMPNYNQLRVAYGLAPKASFAAVVGSGPSSENFPRDPKLTPGNEINQPAALDFTALFDKDGNAIDMTDDNAVENNAVNAKRRTPLAARLKAIYKNVNNLDAFTGMNAEPHVPGTEFGELQLAIWKKQFQALRDGDRFFFGNQPILDSINNLLGINFQRTLAQVIADNTDIPASDLQANVFFAPDEGAAAAKSGGASATKSHGNAPNGAGSNQLLARLKDEE